MRGGGGGGEKSGAGLDPVLLWGNTKPWRCLRIVPPRCCHFVQKATLWLCPALSPPHPSTLSILPLNLLLGLRPSGSHLLQRTKPLIAIFFLMCEALCYVLYRYLSFDSYKQPYQADTMIICILWMRK